MSAQHSARHALPFLITAQAQKEITHNEALILIDALLHPVVQDVTSEPPTVFEGDEGKCWLVGEDATGLWGGHEDKMAVWTGGSWRFLTLQIGAHIFDVSTQAEWRLADSGWIPAPQISGPTGGAMVDSQAREVIEMLLEHFRASGVVASGA